MKSATFKTGLSDHHKLTTTMLRKTIIKGNSQTNLNYFTFHAVFLEILNKITPVKVNVLRFNDNSFMSKSLRKAIMLRSRLKKNFNKKRSRENWDNDKKQRNLCVK